MTYKNFSTILALIVTLSGCQTIIPESFLSKVASLNKHESAVDSDDMTESGSAKDLLETQDVMLAVEEQHSTVSGDAGDAVEQVQIPASIDIVDSATQPAKQIDQESLTISETRQSKIDSLAAEQLNLWSRIRNGLALEHHLDQARVQSEIRWYSNHPDYLDRVADRAARYLHYIVEEIEQRGMPMELALLPIVESAFDPFAYSHGRASGLWQFIPATGRMYGLHVDYWHDGRRDVRLATQGALNYLDKLNQNLDGDWYLALASYNSGEGNVKRSIRKNKKAKKPTDFFSLKLFKETSVYVPRLLAISAIISEPEKYGVTLKPLSNTPYWEAVDIGSQMDLSKAAEAAEIGIKELYLLNPSFNKWSTHPDGPHEILVPVAQVQTLKENLKQLSKEARLSWTRHKIKPGESLSVIANRYHTTITAIRNTNKIGSNLIVAGQSLMIPVASANRDAYQLSDTARLSSKQSSVANQLGADAIHYTVLPGDTLWDLSMKFSVSTRSLAKWNGMAPRDVLRPGKELLIFGVREDAGALALASTPSRKEVIRKVNYRVRKGESLALIANKFNLSVGSIKKWNSKLGRKKYIQPGDRVTLYVDVTQTE
jgi:membrane-bound lytic murein transglycosylase D